MKKEKIFMIISISIFVLCLIGSTYALYKKTLSSNVGINTNTPGLDKYIIYEKGEDITGALTPSSTYVGGKSSNIKFYKKDNTYDIYGKIKLTINSIGTNLSNSNALKYALVNNDTILSEGSLNGTQNGTTITLISNLQLQTTEQYYKVYVWLDINESIENISGESLNVSVDCTAEMVPSLTLAEHITSLYTDAEKEVVTNNSIEYNYATSVSLMNDRLGGTTSDYDAGNIRYYGATPNNYIYFNCSDYSNQNDTTCELWRIIGVFNGKVKIIRNESIGAYSWDNKDTTTGIESNNGKNDWATARLMKLLNPSNYYTIDTNDNGYGQSLYYNGQSGTCFAGSNNATTSCDFTSTGLKNNNTRNMISNEIWYLERNYIGGNYPNNMYISERSKNIQWKGKVGLLYLSELAYSQDFTDCNLDLEYLEYADGSCQASDNWLIDDKNSAIWLMTSGSGYPSFSYVFAAMKSNGVLIYTGSIVEASDTSEVFPTLYLNSNIELASDTGDGTSTNPYRLSV